MQGRQRVLATSDQCPGPPVREKPRRRARVGVGVEGGQACSALGCGGPGAGDELVEAGWPPTTGCRPRGCQSALAPAHPVHPRRGRPRLMPYSMASPAMGDCGFSRAVSRGQGHRHPEEEDAQVDPRSLHPLLRRHLFSSFRVVRRTCLAQAARPRGHRAVAQLDGADEPPGEAALGGQLALGEARRLPGRAEVLPRRSRAGSGLLGRATAVAAPAACCAPGAPARSPAATVAR